jgi:hypothetical protein
MNKGEKNGNLLSYARTRETLKMREEKNKVKNKADA